MASTNNTAEENLDSFIPSGIISLPREIMIEIASSLDPRTILTLIHTSPSFSYLMCIFTSRYTREQAAPGHRYSPLQYFIKRGIERVVLHLLEHGVDPNAAPLRKTPIFLAIQLNSPSMVSLLLRYGARMDDPGGIAGPYRGYTALYRAVMWYNTFQTRRSSNSVESTTSARKIIEIVQILVAAGADVAARTGGGHIPLHIACGTENADPMLVEILIAAGSDIRCGTPPEQLYLDSAAQPIHYAAAAGNTAVVQMLLSAGVDVEVETGDGVRALDLAIMGMHAATFQLLVDVGADTSTRVVVESKLPQRNDPLYLLGDTALWGELELWFRARGWNSRGHSLRIWACVATSDGHPRTEKCGFRRSW